MIYWCNSNYTMYLNTRVKHNEISLSAVAKNKIETFVDNC